MKNWSRKRKRAVRGTLMFNPPIAYFITFTTYGTRLHGDERGTVDPEHNTPGTPFIPPDLKLEALRRDALNEEPLLLDGPMRGVVEAAIVQHCEFRQWKLFAVNVRTNHVHVVVQAVDSDSEKVMVQFKAYATRAMRAKGLLGQRKRVWTEGGSKHWLFNDKALAGACHYVLHEQGPDLPTT